MSAGRHLAAVVIACSTVVSLPTLVVRAQETTAGAEVENSKYQFEGRINASAVYVRSGASDNDYPTMKLDRDATITVVGMKFDWLKVLPPKNSFCYVAKAYVEKRGDGTVGRVTQPINVRVGSDLNALKTKIASKLEAGTDVQIVGEQDEYFKIAPPAGVFVYINKQFVDPIRPVGEESAVAQGTTEQPTAVDPGAAQQPITTITPDPGSGIVVPPVESAVPAQPPVEQAAANPSTQPANVAADDLNKPTLTQAQAEQEFERLQNDLSAANRLPLEQQPLQQLQAGYAKVVAASVLPSTLQREAEATLDRLKVRVEDQQRFAEVVKKQEEARAQQASLQAEQREIEQRIAANEVQVFAAVGTLRVSSLQPGRETLYRLTDPRSGRTLVYIRSNDAEISNLVGQFIGVKGQVQDDQQLQLKVITPAGASLVDPSKVNTKVLAQITPPSLLPQTNTASTD